MPSSARLGARSTPHGEVDVAALTSHLPGAAYVFEMDADGGLSFPFVSTACAEIYGFTAEAAMADASLMHDAIHPEDVDGFRQAGERSMERLCPVLWEGRLIRPDGQVRHVAISSRPRRLPGGNVQWHGVVIDRTDAHARDVRDRLALGRSVRHRGDLLAMASHDFGVPVTSILLSAELALAALDSLDNADTVDRPDPGAGETGAQTDDSEVRQHLARIVRAAQRIDELREDLLVAQAGETERLLVDPRPVLLGAAITAAVAALLDAPPVRVDCPATLRCKAQPSHVGQILTNLLTNAARFARTEVVVRCRAEGGAVVVSIADDGPGVPEVDGSVFDRFTRAEGVRYRGTGLGLFIVQQLAVANGGEIDYETAPSGGAVFVLRLPRCP